MNYKKIILIFAVFFMPLALNAQIMLNYTPVKYPTYYDIITKRYTKFGDITIFTKPVVATGTLNVEADVVKFEAPPQPLTSRRLGFTNANVTIDGNLVINMLGNATVKEVVQASQLEGMQFLSVGNLNLPNTEIYLGWGNNPQFYMTDVFFYTNECRSVSWTTIPQVMDEQGRTHSNVKVLTCNN